jgi:hypothetical protein
VNVTLAERIGNYSSPSSVGSRLRRKRIGPLLGIIAGVALRNGRCSILDVGGTRDYWQIVPEEFWRRHDVSVVIANINPARVGRPEGPFTYARADGCDLPYSDKSFDILHSNSVIEHVGDWDRQVAFSREADRVGVGYFVQTPNYWFPWEPHFGMAGFQFLPTPLQVSLIMSRKRGWQQRTATVAEAMQSIESCRLLDERRFRALFPGAELVRERFAGLTKSLIAVRSPRV